jgi:putative ABC transport system permease protein
MKRKIPLAWLQLSREKARMFVAIVGIGFADMLMFLQLGFRNALFDAAVTFHENLNGDIILISSNYKAVVSIAHFSERILYQAQGFSDVEAVSPIYVNTVQWKNPQTHELWNIFAIAFNPEEPVLTLPGLSESKLRLREPDTVSFDRSSRAELGSIPELLAQGLNVSTEAENRKVTVVGLHTMGTSFAINGSLLMSKTNFIRMFGNKRRSGLIDVGVIKLKTGANVRQVQANLESQLPKDVKVLTKHEFIELEQNYWNTSTPVGYIFDLGVLIGFLVGTIIVYQILYSDVSDHLAEYATLIAVGFSEKYLLVIVFQEAVILACLGFVPGIMTATFFYYLTRQATLLPMIMTIDRSIVILVLTIVMCSLSAAIASRKLRNADPAEIF